MEKEPGFESPSVILRGRDGEEVLLHWGNTCLRLFDNSDFNHIEWTDDDGEVHGIPLDEDLQDMLFERRFPMLTMPYVDRESFEWKVGCETKTLESELEGL